MIAYRTPGVFVVPVPRQRPRNRGHMLVLPTAHVTRIADLGSDALQELYTVSGRVSVAVRAVFGATGATLLQNEDAPDQVLSHVHVHVIPRHHGDGFTLPDAYKDELTRAERVRQAAALRAALSD